jgi:hypothetical protein
MILSLIGILAVEEKYHRCDGVKRADYFIRGIFCCVQREKVGDFMLDRFHKFWRLESKIILLLRDCNPRFLGYDGRFPRRGVDGIPRLGPSFRDNRILLFHLLFDRFLRFFKPGFYLNHQASQPVRAPCRWLASSRYNKNRRHSEKILEQLLARSIWAHTSSSGRKYMERKPSIESMRGLGHDVILMRPRNPK